MYDDLVNFIYLKEILMACRVGGSVLFNSDREDCMRSMLKEPET
jgi:hypothetical protein